MRLVLSVLLAASGLVGADEATDRASIERSVSALNQFRNSAEESAARGSLSETVIADLKALSAVDGTGGGEIWSEKSAPQIIVNSIQFADGGVAVVLASDTRVGSLGMAPGLPLVITAKREGERWVVTSVKFALDPLGRR